MTPDTRSAFAHPEVRAAATAPDIPHDRISLRDHTVEVEIGAYQAERGRTQRVIFNVVVEVRAPDGTAGDDVDRVLSYDRITEAIAEELRAERLNLLETLADRLAARILAHPLALRCFLRIEKPDVGPGRLGVEIVRTSDGASPADATDAPPRPLVVFLSDRAIASPHLGGWIDGIVARGPAILCVAALPLPARAGVSPVADRRIDLLAIAQNAWALAGRDPRCVVVETRSELDWGLRRGQLSVWAPAKMVLDAVTPPDPGADAAGLCGWLAGELAARAVLFVGATPPPGLSADVMDPETESLP